MQKTIAADYSPLREQDHPILFIHSWHFNAGCWVEWIKFYRTKGYDCYALSWPRCYKTSGRPWAHTLDEILQVYLLFIEGKFRKPPILIGHGAGAQIAIMLASRGYALKCVLLGAEQTVRGFTGRYRWRAARNLLLHRDPCTMPSYRSFRQTYANQSSSVAARSLYSKLLVPEHIQTIYNIQRQTFFYSRGVNCPLLFVSGTEDRISLAKRTQKYFLRHHAHSTGNCHRVLTGYDHVQMLEERFLNDVGMLIDIWLLSSMFESERIWPFTTN